MPTVLPGITVERGTVVVDTGRAHHPGDVLHEAGHLAVLPAAERAAVGGRIAATPAEEMSAIAWSYAAAVHLALPPEVVFHEDGYRGGSPWLLETFAAGHHLALPMLEWLGLAAGPARAVELGVAPYPHMLAWVRT